MISRVIIFPCLTSSAARGSVRFFWGWQYRDLASSSLRQDQIGLLLKRTSRQLDGFCVKQAVSIFVSLWTEGVCAWNCNLFGLRIFIREWLHLKTLYIWRWVNTTRWCNWQHSRF